MYLKLVSSTIFLIMAGVTINAKADDTVYSSYTGSQKGVTIRDQVLNQKSSFNTGITASGIALGENNNIYLSAGNHIYNFGNNGNLITKMTFPNNSINYTGVSVGGGNVIASYDGAAQGVTVRDYELNQKSYFGTNFNINGIAAGANNNVYLASGNHLYDYNINGTLITEKTYLDPSIQYSAIAFGNDMIYASYTGSQNGVTLRDLALNQSSYFSVNFSISGIAIGGHDDVYLSSGNSLYDYKLNGTEISAMTFPSNSINYSGVAVSSLKSASSVSAVPEPDTCATILAGLGLMGFMVHRRKSL